MAISAISGNPNPTPQVQAVQQTPEPRANEDVQRTVETRKTDTVTISQDAQQAAAQATAAPEEAPVTPPATQAIKFTQLE